MRTGGKILVDQLISRGTNKVFCVPGESYLEILDACRSIEYFIKNNKVHGIYNINTFNLTVREIINEIENNVDKLEIEYVKSKIMNQLSYFVSNDKVINSGFKFRGSLKESITDTFKWFN